MAREIERKFLVTSDAWRSAADGGARIRQAYLSQGGTCIVRVRTSDDREAVLTIKSTGPGVVRDEFEYAIPIEDARELLELRTGEVIEKRRHLVRTGGQVWQVDVFAGAHAGLVLAEIELPQAADAPFERPPWLGAEVTDDPRYYNNRLAATGSPPE